MESHWQQETPEGAPLVSFDFGYGIMQITSGMAGAFGSARGSIGRQVQSEISSSYTYNIAYGARVLSQKWEETPEVGRGDPSAVEDWYYALWAYNGWGWVNNPNNGRFSRKGTPASNPANFPYQERVLYLVAHPPTDANGNPLWQAVPVSLPSRAAVGRSPGRLQLSHSHRRPPRALDAVYQPPSLAPLPPGGTATVSVPVTNTGTAGWKDSGSEAVSLAYDLFTAQGNPLKAISPFAPGVVAYSQGVSSLPQALAPGATAVVKVLLQAPATAGAYRVVWDLREGPVTFFSTRGVFPFVEPLQVGPSPASTPTPSPRSAPSTDLKYVADTSIPDGTVLRAGQRFVKGWLVLNSGKKRWQTGWMLHSVKGQTFGRKLIHLPALYPCRSTRIVSSMHAPERAGSYRGAWRLEDSSGHGLGQKLTVVVSVAGHSTPR
ncbi:MAG: NBR1-Ig-like domain-containing protein, partial [Chloroflexota bacterium]